jgi:hypothetical protein
MTPPENAPWAPPPPTFGGMPFYESHYVPRGQILVGLDPIGRSAQAIIMIGRGLERGVPYAVQDVPEASPLIARGYLVGLTGRRTTILDAETGKTHDVLSDHCVEVPYRTTADIFEDVARG